MWGYKDNLNLGVFRIPKIIVERMDTDFVYNDGLVHLIESPEMIKKNKNKIIFSFEGYDDPRETYHIFEIKEYLQALTVRFPYWFYFCPHHVVDDTLKMIVLAHCKTQGFGGGSVKIDLRDVENVCDMLSSHLLEFYNKYDLPQAEYFSEMKEVQEYLIKKTSGSL
jgi:hypothetical protein